MARSSCASVGQRPFRARFGSTIARLLALGPALVTSSLVPGCVGTGEEPGSSNPGAPGAGPSTDCRLYPALGAEQEALTLNMSDPVPAGMAQGDASGPYAFDNVTIKGGGFVSGIVFSPAAPNVLYSRTDVGGAYRYEISTGRWRALTDWIGANESNLMGIESIATDPTDPSKVYLAAGTYITAGAGQILSSSDFGASFERHNIGVPMGGNDQGRSMGERLAVDPNLPSVLYFGSRNDGLLVSRDSAASWQAVSGFPTRGALNLGVSFVLFDQRSGSASTATPVIYVGVARAAADDARATAGAEARNPADALYRSMDGGTTWEPVPGQPATMMPHHAALDGEGRMYLAYSDRPGPNDIRSGAVWRFDTASSTWADITPPRPAGQRGGFAGVTVDAQKPGVVMVSTMDVWSPDEIYRSTSAGECWTALGSAARRDLAGAEWLKFGGSTVSATGWMGDIEIDPFNSGRALYITGQGIWWSDNVHAADVARATEWEFHNEGLEETVALGLASPPSGAPLLSAVGDIAGFRHDDFSTSPPMFTNPTFGNTSSLDFAEQQPSMIVRVGTNSARHGAYSTDGAETWTPFPTEPPGSTGEGVVAISANGSSIVWDPRGAAPHYSLDRGVTWIQSAGFMDAPGNNTVGLASDRVNPLKFYARQNQNQDQTLFVSTDGGATFAVAATNIGVGGGARLRASFGAEGDLWISSNSGLWHSTDSGQSLTRLPNVASAPAFGFGQAAPGQATPAVYLSGNVNNQVGLYRSDNSGQSWVAIDDSAHKFGYINHVSGDPNVYGRVYLGTGGRGIIVGDLR